MTEWMNKAKELLETITNLPASPAEWVTTAVLCTAGFLIFMALCGMALRLPIANSGQRLAAGLVALVLSLAAATAIALYVAPRFENAILRHAVVIAAPLLVFLAIAVPLGALLLRTGYFRSLFSLVISLACAWGVSLIGSQIFLAARSGVQQARQVAERTEQVNEAVGKKEEPPPGKINPIANPRQRKEMQEKEKAKTGR